MKTKIVIITVIAFVFGALSALAMFPASWPSWLGSVPTQKPTGKALIGGAFTLYDHTGKQVTDKDYRGKFMLVYFGYTFCPDVCPSELQVISAALDQLKEKADKITPLFITVDPLRDDVKQMASYVSNFHKSLVGLTGSPTQIKKAAKAYRVFYAKAQQAPGEVDNDNYAMDHSSIIYLMGKNGDYLAHFSYGTDPAKMAAKIAKFL